LALWWASAYTATAPAQDAVDRRAEVAADVADQVRAAGGVGRVVSRQIAGRVLRGVGSDVLWRMSVERSPGRAEWHLDHPATLLGTLAVLLTPMVALGDTLRRTEAGSPGRVLALVHSAEVLVGAAILAIALSALLRRLVQRRRDTPGGHRAPLDVARRSIAWLACASYGASALWRFVPGSLGGLAAAAYVVLGLALIGWTAVAALGWAVGRWERRRD
jgi:hypothetical protein